MTDHTLWKPVPHPILGAIVAINHFMRMFFLISGWLYLLDRPKSTGLFISVSLGAALWAAIGILFGDATCGWHGLISSKGTTKEMPHD